MVCVGVLAPVGLLTIHPRGISTTFTEVTNLLRHRAISRRRTRTSTTGPAQSGFILQAPHMSHSSLTTSRYYQRLCALLLLARVLSDELISDLIEGRELDAVVRLEVLDETLQHELYLRAP